MKPLNLNDVVKYVETNIKTFHAKRLASLDELKLSAILKRKNPYLFKAKNILTAQDIVKALLDAHLSSQEETIFGEFLEQLAIFICENVYGGTKSAAEGIDLEFEKDGVKYAHTINPKTGYPVISNLLSATVVADDCMTADAYATAFMVMGLDKSIDFLDHYKSLDAYLIYSDEKGRYKVYYSGGFSRYLAEQL